MTIPFQDRPELPPPPGAGARWHRRVHRAAMAKLSDAVGGDERRRIVLILAAVLAMSSADTSTVGASATELRQSLHISNADIGLLVAASAGVGAIGGVPFGILVDRVRRIPMLAGTIVLWGVAMVASATVSSFGPLLLIRLLLGLVTAVAGPAVASLVGDYFSSDERGHIYGYILTGELLGAGAGFFITGDVAAISWRAAFLLLAIPAFFLAWQVIHLREPERGAGARMEVDSDGAAHITDVQRTARSRGVLPNPDLVLHVDARSMNIIEATRYVLRVRTNVVLIISSACAYFFMTGVQTFGLEFVSTQYGVSTVLANLLMLVVGVGAVLGVIVGGFGGDALVRRGWISGRMLVAGVAATGTACLFLPPLLTHSPMTALPYITGAAFCLTAQNPTLDAARLDIMPPRLWGRAEGVRTLLRAGAQSVAPVVFGGLSDLLAGTHQGLKYTFLIMLLPLLASGVILLRGLRHYPTDVATAAASTPA
jgi:MFS family permease